MILVILNMYFIIWGYWFFLGVDNDFFRVIQFCIIDEIFCYFEYLLQCVVENSFNFVCSFSIEFGVVDLQYLKVGQIVIV